MDKSDTSKTQEEAESEIARLTEAVDRLTTALARANPSVKPGNEPLPPVNANAFVYDAATGSLRAVNRVSAPSLELEL